jgi:hypothetical protein
VTESSDLAPGSFVSVTATPAAGGGSDVHGIWERGATTFKGRAILALMRVLGSRVLSTYLRKVYDALPDA